MCVCYTGWKKYLVYDPHMGIDSTELACKKLDINCIGIEIGEGYVDVAKQRLQEIMLCP